MTADATVILAEATSAQQRAAHPEASIWVAASAGSGKTKVLTDRVLSLLLNGTPAHRILCLTFTKAAAAEMANRLSKRLAEWTVCGTGDLTADLQELLGYVPDETLVIRARRLFAQVLDTPGGMKIQTVHAFCQSLLGRFPLEAGIAPHSRVVDEREAREMLEELRIEIVSRGHSSEQEGLGTILSEVARQAHEQTFSELLTDLIRERSRLTRLMRHAGGSAGLRAAVFGHLGIPLEAKETEILTRACEDPALALPDLQRIAAAMQQGSKTDRQNGSVIAAWLASPHSRIKQFEPYLAAYFTEGGRGALRKKLIHKEALALAPDGSDVLEREAGRLELLRQQLNGLAVARATAALLELGARILEGYETRKREAALLDYDDLILLSRDLLEREGGAGWVLYKLDGGLDHLLIDEAQDTNPEQWQIVRLLTDEFYAGEGGAEQPRTVFAVGDAKQSIYSFQRADPAEFARMQSHFAQRADAAGQYWDKVDLHVSFRSTDAVLRVVDAVFASEPARDGVIADGETMEHLPVRLGHAGLVELWPPVAPEPAEAPEAWALTGEVIDDSPPAARLAEQIARTIWRWTRSGAGDADRYLPARARPIRPGDILVLVRRRNAFVEDLVRRLKQLDVPVAGLDRMVLTDQLAVMDLVALGRVLLLPNDDLTLATVLKGPLIGFNEDALFDLAHRRTGSLWHELTVRQDECHHFAEAATFLQGLMAQADFVPPYELFAQVLGPHGGRRRLQQRLGTEAHDPIEEFMSLALRYEQEHRPSLEGFLHWLERGEQEIKRDMEHGADSVRVMTVHAAKGLQAPVVFLPDTMQMPQAARGLLWSARDDDPPVWVARKALDGPATERLRTRQRQIQEQEYRRLLYVAMTRAEDRLYVCGWRTQKSEPEGCWYELVRRAMTRITGVAEAEFDCAQDFPGGWAGLAYRLETPQTAEPDLREAASGRTRAEATLPAWATRNPEPEPIPPKPLAPSRPRDAEPPVRSPLAAAAGDPFKRGRVIHRLLQSLPDLPQGAWEAAGRRFLAAPVQDLSAAAQKEVLATTLAVLRDPRLEGLFGPDSRAEVPLTGLLDGPEGPEAVSGQIDRLLVRDGVVSVVDYKTQRPAPPSEAQVPVVYLRQMAVYRAILRKIYPKHALSSFLLWTDGPRLMQLSDEVLAAHAP